MGRMLVCSMMVMRTMTIVATSVTVVATMRDGRFRTST